MKSLNGATELAALFEIATFPTRLRNLDQLGALVVDKAVRLLESDVAVFYTYRPDKRALCPRAAQGVALDQLAELTLDTLDHACVQAVSGKQPTAWLQTDSTALPHPLPGSLQMQAALYAPAWADELKGVVYAGRRAAQPYTTLDQALFGILAGQVANAIENAAAFQKLEQAAADLKTINQIGAALTSSLEMDDLLSKLHTHLNRLLDAQSFFVSLSDREAEEWGTVYRVEQGQRQPATRHSAQAGLTGYIIKQRQPVLLHTPEEIAAFLKLHTIEPIDKPVRSWLGVPLMTQDKVLGVLAVQSYTQNNRYTENDAMLLSAIAGHVAVAVDNIRALADVKHAHVAAQQHSEQLKTLHKVMLALTKGQRDTQEVMNVLTQRAMTLLDCDGGGLWLWREREQYLELTFEVQASRTGVGRRLKPGEGMVGQAFSDKKMLAISDYRQWEGRVGCEVPYISALAAPMLWQDQVFGVLTFTRSQKQPFSAHEQYLAEFMAGQAAAVIQNAQLFEQMQHSLRRADALYHASRTLIEIENMEHAMDAAAQGAADGIRADMCAINVINIQKRTLDYVTVKGPHAPQTFAAAPFEEVWNGLSGMALRDMQPVFSPKWMMPDPRESPEAQRRRVEFGGGSIIIAPMQYHGEILGTLSACNRIASPDFTEEDVDLLVAIANQAAAAIMNARLFDQTRATLAESQKRLRQLRAASEVARAISTILDLNELLPRVVDVIRERFELYYAGLFLLDAAEKWAILRAGTGKAGQAMLQAGHKLEIGGQSMIGACIAQNQARIALDVGIEAVRFKNPYLPDTHSEMALPLASRGRVIGAMTIQSSQVNAFSPEDITALQAMADQVAVAIDNARLFAESQAALEEMQALQRRYTGQVWEEYTTRRTVSGYAHSGAGIAPLAPETIAQAQAAIDKAFAEHKPVAVLSDGIANPPADLVMPILLRGQPIGALGLKKEGGRAWSQEEIALVESIIEQFALAADNLRLLDETQRRAALEQIINTATANIRGAATVNAILQRAVEQLGTVFGASRAAIRLELARAQPAAPAPENKGQE